MTFTTDALEGLQGKPQKEVMEFIKSISCGQLSRNDITKGNSSSDVYLVEDRETGTTYYVKALFQNGMGRRPDANYTAVASLFHSLFNFSKSIKKEKEEDEKKEEPNKTKKFVSEKHRKFLSIENKISKQTDSYLNSKYEDLEKLTPAAKSAWIYDLKKLLNNPSSLTKEEDYTYYKYSSNCFHDYLLKTTNVLVDELALKHFSQHLNLDLEISGEPYTFKIIEPKIITTAEGSILTIRPQAPGQLLSQVNNDVRKGLRKGAIIDILRPLSKVGINDVHEHNVTIDEESKTIYCFDCGLANIRGLLERHPVEREEFFASLEKYAKEKNPFYNSETKVWHEQLLHAFHKPSIGNTTQPTILTNFKTDLEQRTAFHAFEDEVYKWNDEFQRKLDIDPLPHLKGGHELAAIGEKLAQQKEINPDQRAILNDANIMMLSFIKRMSAGSDASSMENMRQEFFHGANEPFFKWANHVFLDSHRALQNGTVGTSVLSESHTNTFKTLNHLHKGLESDLSEYLSGALKGEEARKAELLKIENGCKKLSVLMEHCNKPYFITGNQKTLLDTLIAVNSNVRKAENELLNYKNEPPRPPRPPVSKNRGLQENAQAPHQIIRDGIILNLNLLNDDLKNIQNTTNPKLRKDTFSAMGKHCKELRESIERYAEADLSIREKVVLGNALSECKEKLGIAEDLLLTFTIQQAQTSAEIKKLQPAIGLDQNLLNQRKLSGQKTLSDIRIANNLLQRCMLNLKSEQPPQIKKSIFEQMEKHCKKLNLLMEQCKKSSFVIGDEIDLKEILPKVKANVKTALDQLLTYVIQADQPSPPPKPNGTGPVASNQLQIPNSETNTAALQQLIRTRPTGPFTPPELEKTGHRATAPLIQKK